MTPSCIHHITLVKSALHSKAIIQSSCPLLLAPVIMTCRQLCFISPTMLCQVIQLLHIRHHTAEKRSLSRRKITL